MLPRSRRKGRLHNGKVMVMRSEWPWRRSPCRFMIRKTRSNPALVLRCLRDHLLPLDFAAALGLVPCFTPVQSRSRTALPKPSSKLSNATTLASIHCRMLLQCSGRSPGGSMITTRATLTQGSEWSRPGSSFVLRLGGRVAGQMGGTPPRLFPPLGRQRMPKAAKCEPFAFAHLIVRLGFIYLLCIASMFLSVLAVNLIPNDWTAPRFDRTGSVAR
jgi:hypothetical protein